MQQQRKNIESSSYVVVAGSGKAMARTLGKSRNDDEMNVYNGAVVVIILLRRRVVRSGEAHVHVLIRSHHRSDKQRQNGRNGCEASHQFS